MNKKHQLNPLTDAILIIIDELYLKFIVTLLHSLHNTNHKFTVIICLINFKDNQKIEKDLKELYPNLICKHLKEEFNSAAEKKSFCANYRVHFINEILTLNYKRLLYLDADSIVRKDLRIADLQIDSDIEILFRNTEDLRMKVASGAILIKNNKKAKLFIKIWKDKISNNLTKWFSDQETFYETYSELKNQVSCRMIDSRLIDWDFKDSSIIWAGKGNRKYKNFIYLIESAKVRIKNKQVIKILSVLQNALRFNSKF